MTTPTPDLAVIRDAVESACRAPSVHNSQPWRWVTDGPSVHLFADTSRLMSAADPQGREITLSCGAALDHFVVAIAAAGWDTTVTRFPDRDKPSHLASITFRPAPPGPTAAAVRLAEAIPRRHTDRRPFGQPGDWTRIEVSLRQAIIPFHVMCDVVLDEARPKLAQASRLTQEIRQNDPSYEAELQWWTSPFVTGEGVPQSALVSAAQAALVEVARDFPAGPTGASLHGIPDQSKIVVLSTHHEDARLDVLRCGEALSALLLECTVAGLATCTLTHMTELAPSREIVRELTGQHGLPQVLIRVGTSLDDEGAVQAETPRRPVNDVFDVRTHH
ncbi:nitroreductase [Mycobacterium sp. OAS707]|uniref:Acg family FMN-binding oxidoreductase n=1 Tax=Mycobacterium sp. OAS707 TaxID=2663822 RepID=UPI00178A7ADB|nr:NAD(P)H nitroreductase [Mycobacterium sp. OAS707]MBE1546448.1 nitroreductase [Mycobacterium sp. OAS707]